MIQVSLSLTTIKVQALSEYFEVKCFASMSSLASLRRLYTENTTSTIGLLLELVGSSDSDVGVLSLASLHRLYAVPPFPSSVLRCYVTAIQFWEAKSIAGSIVSSRVLTNKHGRVRIVIVTAEPVVARVAKCYRRHRVVECVEPAVALIAM
jgi:hypothetical protein